jgi:hypothetical protein
MPTQISMYCLYLAFYIATQEVLTFFSAYLWVGSLTFELGLVNG